jgi:serine/threonine-protein kinase
MRPQVGQVINNKYRLLRLIGDGGMGSVYEARHEVLGTSVALKFLHAELGKRTGLVQRFLQEARVSAQIVSPHVVRVTDVDQAATGAFIVMEYIEGKTLQTLYEELFRAGLQLSQADAIEYAMQMLEGVEAAHRQGIVHRDLKPDNVIITLDQKGRPLIKLLDFGIAKLRASAEFERGLTRPGVIMGTPEYMAPEQAYSADAVDARADIFSLGVIIFEMLGGRRPVGGEDPHQIAGAYLSGQIARLTDLAPDIPLPLADAIHRAMAPVATARWESVTEFRDAMQPYAAPPRPPTALPPSPSLSGEGNGLSPARVSASGETPKPSAPGSYAGQPVAKTLPPESRAAEGLARDPQTNPAAPPSMSEPPPREPTPPDAFKERTDADGAPPAMTGEIFKRVSLPSAPRSSAGLANIAGAGMIPETRSVMPLSSKIDPAATAAVSPIAGFNATAPLGPSEMALRQSVVVGDPNRANALGETAPAPSGMPRMSSTSSDPSAPRSYAGTASAKPVTPPVVVSKRAPPQGSNARRPSVLSSLPAILLLAAGVSAAVVGGVYIAHSRAKADDHEDPPAPPVPATTVAPDPAPPVDNAPGPAPAPAPAPTITRPPPRQPPKNPPPKGSSGPVAPQPSSTAPQADPLFPFPAILPSSLPIDLPFFPPRRDDPPRDQPNPPPNKPAPRQAPAPRGDHQPGPEIRQGRAHPAPDNDDPRLGRSYAPDERYLFAPPPPPPPPPEGPWRRAVPPRRFDAPEPWGSW